MAFEIGAIVGKLILDTDEFEKPLSKAEKKAKELAENQKKAFLGIAGAAAAVGAAMFAMAKHTANFRDELMKSARAAGVGVKDFSGLAYAAQLSGVSIEQLGKGMRELANPSKEAAAALQQLGVATKDVNGNQKLTSDILRDLADKFKGMSSAQEKAAYATQIFGNRGAEMVNLLVEGGDGIDAMTAKAERLGLVFDEKAGQAAEKFNDDLDDLMGSVNGLTQAVGAQLITFANTNNIITSLTDTVVEFRNDLQYIQPIFEELGKEILEIIPGLTSFKGGAENLKVFGKAVAMLAVAIGTLYRVWIGFYKGIIEAGERLSKALAFLTTGDLENAGRAFRNAGVVMSKNLVEPLQQAAEKILKIYKDDLGAALAASSKENGDAAGRSFGEGMKNGLDKSAKKVAKAAMVGVKEATDTGGGMFKMAADAGMQIGQAFVENMAAQVNAQLQKFSQIQGFTDLFGTLAINNLKKQSEEEIRIITETEDAKIKAIQDASIERLAIMDEEFRKLKEQSDVAFQDFVDKRRMEFEIQMAKLDAEAADDEQRKINRAIMEEQWLGILAELRAGHNAELSNMETTQGEKEREEKKKTADAVTKQEETKQAKITAAQEKQAKEEKRIRKEVAFIKYIVDVAALQVSKQLQRAQAAMSYAQAIMSAVQAAASMAASLPFAGAVLGAAFAATMIGLATSTYHTTVGAINSQFVMPPAELFMAQGGMIVGPSHAQGGVPVRAEGGEFMIDKARSERMLDAIDRGGSGVAITFGANAIIIHATGPVDERAINGIAEVISEKIARKMERRR